MKARKKGTKTSVFGVSGRIGHDSTPFYNSRLYEGLPQERKVEYKENLLRCKDEGEELNLKDKHPQTRRQR